MLDLLLGASGTGKTREIYKRICGCKSDTIFFVPDQFMFEAEKLIASALGEKTLKVKVTGFSALSEEILNKYLPRKSYADNTAKLVIMMRAVSSLRGSLRYYGQAAGKARFPSFMLDAVHLLKSAGITSDMLEKAIENSSFPDKLSDILTISTLYDSLLTEVYDDRHDNLLLAAKAAEEHKCFENYDVFIDGFDSFSGSQLRFLQPLVTMSKSCTVTLTIEKNSDKSCFEPTVRTKRTLERFAAEDFIEVKEEWFCNADRYKSPALAALQKGLFSDTAEDMNVSEQDSEAVAFAVAPDIESETDYVCANIKKLMRSGYRCSDITVLCPETESYLETVKSAFARYEIPLFADIPEPVSKKPLIRYIDALLTAADAPNGDNMLRYIKSGFVRIDSDNGKTRPVTLREINDIEEFSDRWGLGKRMWTRPFLRCETPAEQRSEQIRSILAGQLVKLRRDCDGADGRKMTELLIDFLFDTADISAAIQGKCQDYTTRSLRYDKSLTEEYNSLWELIYKLFMSIWETTEGMKLTLKEYLAVFNTCAQQLTMSLPPQVLDSVLFGDLARTRTAGARVVFIMGAKDGAFPDYSDKSPGIFTPSENAELSLLDIDLMPDDELNYSSALLNVYKAMLLPKERLFVTRTGARDEKTEIFTDVKELIPHIEELDISALPVEFFCESIESARTYFARARLSGKSVASVIEQALKAAGDEEFPMLVSRADSKLSDDSYIHNIGPAASLIFRQALLSPTAIESLNGCKFEYFCRYGLKLKDPPRNTLTPQSFGETVHYVMKQCLEQIYSGDKPPEEYSPDDLSQLIDSALDKFLEKNFLPEEESSHRFTAQYKSIGDLCDMLLGYMLGELKDSDFTPKYFELSLEDGKTMPDGFSAKPFELEVPLPDGGVKTVKIRGTVDRVDISGGGNGNWIRVIDYKTGPKDFSLKKVYYGLNLQLLLYLFTLCKNNSEYGASAATYYPSGSTPLIDTDKEPDEQTRRELWLKEHSGDGITVIDSPSDIERRNYIAAALDKKKAKSMFSADMLSLEGLYVLEERICCQLSENISAVTGGDVSAVPVVNKNDLLACAYCKYRSVCGRRPQLERAVRDISRQEASGFADMLKGKDRERSDE